MENSFYFSSHLTNFLFNGLSVSSTGGIIGLIVFIGLIPFAYEAIHVLRDVLARRRQSLKDVRNVETETVSLRTGFELSIMDRSLYLATQSGLYMLEIFCFYIIMLSLSTYNAWLLIALLIGAGLAYFFLDPYIQHIAEHKVSRNLVIQTNYSSDVRDTVRDDDAADGFTSDDNLSPESPIKSTSCH